MQKHKIKVSIGLCVKNIEATVTQAMKSILAQNFPKDRMELIVVDGYSKDSTLKIIKNMLSYTGIKHSISLENKGLGYARQLVVETSKSDYIVWIDGDMIIPRDYVEKQVEFMDSNPSVGIGRAHYGLLPGEKTIAFLENIPFVVQSSKYEYEVPLEISGTEGSIYRRKAVIQAGGFDTEIVGAAEDTELAKRIKAIGWLSCITPAVFYEKCRDSWKGIWDEYFWWGYGGHYLFHKDSEQSKLYRMAPPVGFLVGLLFLSKAYQLSKRNSTFLLPFHYSFKRIAWCCGFVKSHIDRYGH